MSIEAWVILAVCTAIVVLCIGRKIKEEQNNAD